MTDKKIIKAELERRRKREAGKQQLNEREEDKS